jgi:hypothetical protein
MSLFNRKPRTRTFPHAKPVTVPVNVTVTHREAPTDALPFVVDPELAARIRADLPNQPVSENLRAARLAKVLDREADFLSDKTGTVEPPERREVIAACRFAAEHIRDGIVIA